MAPPAGRGRCNVPGCKLSASEKDGCHDPDPGDIDGQVDKVDARHRCGLPSQGRDPSVGPVHGPVPTGSRGVIRRFMLHSTNSVHVLLHQNNLHGGVVLSRHQGHCGLLEWFGEVGRLIGTARSRGGTLCGVQGDPHAKSAAHSTWAQPSTAGPGLHGPADRIAA